MDHKKQVHYEAKLVLDTGAEAKPVPGPWGTVHNGLNDVVEIYGGGVNTFAVVFIKRGELKKALATARLIAEAPALLEALEGYARMAETILNLEAVTEKDITELKTALRFVDPQTRAVIARTKVGVK